MKVPISDRSDARLVRDVLGGDVEAFNLLVTRWERKIYSYLVNLVGYREEVFDLCQEVFVSAYEHLKRLREPEKFPAWLFEIAHNRATSFWRASLFREAGLLEDDPPASPGPLRAANGRVWQRGELKRFVHEGLAMLPIEQRDAIILKVFHGFKFTEIAEIQNCPLSTVKTRVYAGFELLKKIMRT